MICRNRRNYLLFQTYTKQMYDDFVPHPWALHQSTVSFCSSDHKRDGSVFVVDFERWCARFVKFLMSLPQRLFSEGLLINYVGLIFFEFEFFLAFPKSGGSFLHKMLVRRIFPASSKLICSDYRQYIINERSEEKDIDWVLFLFFFCNKSWYLVCFINWNSNKKWLVLLKELRGGRGSEKGFLPRTSSLWIRSH